VMGLEDDGLEPLRGPLRALAMQKKLDAVAAGGCCLLLGKTRFFNHCCFVIILLRNKSSQSV
jgi:hypothetical protein